MEAAFDALGDPTRRRILEALADGERPAGAVVEMLQAGQPISQPAVSQHLKILRKAGLLVVRAEGTRRLYALDRAGVRQAGAWLAHLAEPASAVGQPLDALATEIARGRRQRASRRDDDRRRAAEAG